MTKKNLKWRLSELPTGSEVAELVAEGVITKDEARDILFNEEKSASNKVKELEEEVKFLRELCDKLAAKSNGWTTIIREYRDYTPRYPMWYQSYGTAINAGATTFTAGAVGNTSVSLMGASQNAPKQLLSKLN